MTPLQKLHKQTSDKLTTREVADILGQDKRVIYDLTNAQDNALECQAHHGHGGRRKDVGTKRRPTLSFTRLAVLSYLVRCTRGDRAALMAEVELLFPKWLPFAQRVAKEADARRAPAPAEKAPNVIDFHQAATARARSPRAPAPTPAQMELFG